MNLGHEITTLGGVLMKKVIILALTLLLLFSTGCTLIDKLAIGGRAADFFAAWVGQNESALKDALTDEVTYNGLNMPNSAVATDLAQAEWWDNYVTVRDSKSVTDLDGGKATVNYEFSIMEKEKPETEKAIAMALIYTKSDWVDWKICSVEINPIWITP